jgi:hypothetical protein
MNDKQSNPYKLPQSNAAEIEARDKAIQGLFERKLPTRMIEGLAHSAGMSISGKPLQERNK